MKKEIENLATPSGGEVDVEGIAREIFKVLTVEVCCQCGEPRFPQKQQAGDETKVGWPACVNEKCEAYGEQVASAAYRTPISDEQRAEILAILSRRIPAPASPLREAQAALERDRTQVAGCVSAIKDTIRAYDWLLDGRGCYEWDDDRWHDEFRKASSAIWAAIEPMIKIAADWTNCPQTDAEIKAARATRAPATPVTHGFKDWIQGYRGIRHINDWLPPDWLELGQDYGDYRAKAASTTQNGAGWERPKIVCLIGSTRFANEFMAAQFRESVNGKVVLTVGCFPRKPDGTWDRMQVTDEQKVALDALHFRKIEMADEVLVLNVGGYIGESTTRELAHAVKLGKTINYLEPAPPVTDGSERVK
jgi:hypothetical protein